MLRTVAATRYVTPLREGGSLPGLIEADDDGLYVVKFRAAGQGLKALVAEVIVGELARAAGLPVPELVLVELDPALGRTEPDPEINELITASAGLNLRDRLPARRARLQPGAPGALDRRAGFGDRLVRRAHDQRRPHPAQPEPARLAPRDLADRPRRRALPAPQRPRPGRPRAMSRSR